MFEYCWLMILKQDEMTDDWYSKQMLFGGA